MRYMNVDAPPFLDRFRDLRHIRGAFNDHYKLNYLPAWLNNCLDKSVNSLLDKFCPGFMCVPRKPHPFVNKYHSISDGSTEEGREGNPIMWAREDSRGKGSPKES
jgi:hypothetical protein